VRVGGGARVVVASACDAMLGFHRLRWKCGGVVLILSLDVGSNRQGGGEPKSMGRNLVHWFLRCR
jgi:hypothetical protein